jgi:hypothetical protein
MNRLGKKKETGLHHSVIGNGIDTKKERLYYFFFDLSKIFFAPHSPPAAKSISMPVTGIGVPGPPPVGCATASDVLRRPKARTALKTKYDTVLFILI